MPTHAPSTYSPGDLDRIIGPIALYTDDLLAQMLTASTFPDQMPNAARWAQQHHDITGDKLAEAIAGGQLSEDPSVQALLPFPYVLGMMASDMKWTNDLGIAVLAQRPALLDAVQQMRRKATDYGYLRSNAEIIVSDGPYIEIKPANLAFVAVPTYNPLIVFTPPQPGFVLSRAIGFGSGVAIGPSLRPWGWGASRIAWDRHALIINNVPWDRTWANRATYVHPYPGVHHPAALDQPHEFHTDPLDE
jgi:hypothetical protein